MRIAGCAPLRALEKIGTLSLARFYSRRVKHLLPMTVVVLEFVVVFSWWIGSCCPDLPQERSLDWYVLDIGGKLISLTC